MKKVLLICLFAFLSGSCDQMQEVTYEYGQLSTTQDVLDALLVAAITSTKFDQSQPDDWVAVEQTQRVPGGLPFVTGYEDYTVLERSETDEQIDIRFLKERFDSERNLIENTAFDIVVGKEDPADTDPVDDSSQIQALKILSNRVQTQSATQNFYNVALSVGTMGAPREVAQQPNCAGIPNCEIPVQIVSFDLVTEFDDGSEPSVLNYKVYFSDQIPGYWATTILGLGIMSPAFPGHVKACLSTIIQDNNQDQPIEICEGVVDFLPLP